MYKDLKALGILWNHKIFRWKIATVDLPAYVFGAWSVERHGFLIPKKKMVGDLHCMFWENNGFLTRVLIPKHTKIVCGVIVRGKMGPKKWAH